AEGGAHVDQLGWAFGARSALRAARWAGRDMRVDRGQTEQDQEFRQYVQQAAASSPASTAKQLAKLADLRDRGSSPPRGSSGRRPRSFRPDQLASLGRMRGWTRRPRGSRNSQPFTPGSD